MSDLPLELQDVIPFTIKDSDGLTELRALRRAVELSLGFKLLFVAPKDPRLSNELCETILKELGEIEPYVVRFDRPLHDLLGELERRIGSKAPQAVIVLGLELSMPDVDRVRTGEFVANLNTSRDRFPGVVMSPLLLVIDQDRLRELARGLQISFPFVPVSSISPNYLQTWAVCSICCSYRAQQIVLMLPSV